MYLSVQKRRILRLKRSRRREISPLTIFRSLPWKLISQSKERQNLIISEASALEKQERRSKSKKATECGQVSTSPSTREDRVRFAYSFAMPDERMIYKDENFAKRNLMTDEQMNVFVRKNLYKIILIIKNMCVD